MKDLEKENAELQSKIIKLSDMVIKLSEKLQACAKDLDNAAALIEQQEARILLLKAEQKGPMVEA